ncbi:MAG: hypothetical protein GX971_08805 [Firmicutes bacterium]|nr:hypothetical protein [Bacillota bacterium]
MSLVRFKPMLPSESPLLDETGFLHEIKWDGFRALAYLDGDKVLLESRNGRSLNDHFPEVVKALQKEEKHAVLDGELIALSLEGKVDFSLLRQSKLASEQVRFVVFDLLFLDGETLCAKPWLQRRDYLDNLIMGQGLIMRSPLLAGDLQTNLNFAKEQQLEGIISKHQDSPYLPGVRSAWWRKSKIRRSLDCVVVGLRLRDEKVRSLAVGLYQNDDSLLYIGNVGSGLGQDELVFLRESINLLAHNSPLVTNPPGGGVDWIWFKPHLVVEVEYLELTHQKRLRHPTFLRFRFDKIASECRIEGELR